VLEGTSARYRTQKSNGRPLCGAQAAASGAAVEQSAGQNARVRNAAAAAAAAATYVRTSRAPERCIMCLCDFLKERRKK